MVAVTVRFLMLVVAASLFSGQGGFSKFGWKCPHVGHFAHIYKTFTMQGALRYRNMLEFVSVELMLGHPPDGCLKKIESR